MFKFNHSASNGETYVNVSMDDLARIAPGEIVPAARAQKLAELSVACGAAIVGGFQSSALGALYHYPGTQIDQLNLTALFTASLAPGLAPGWHAPFSCADTLGVWARRDHTAAQMQAAFGDGKSRYIACVQHLDSKRAEVAAASTREHVEAVAWSLT